MIIIHQIEKKGQVLQNLYWHYGKKVKNSAGQQFNPYQ